MNKGIQIGLIVSGGVLIISIFIFAFFLFGEKSSTTTPEQESGGFLDFLGWSRPDTQNENPTNEPGGETGTSTPINTNSTISGKKVTDKKVLSVVTTQNSIRFTEAGTGKLFEIDQNGTEKQISERGLENIAQFLWGNGGLFGVLRQVSSTGVVSNQSVTIPTLKSSTSTTLLGFGFLPIFTDIATSPVDQRFAYLLSENKSTKLIITAPGSTSKSTVWTSSFNDWRLGWPEKNTLELLTKPSSHINGSVYHVKISSGGSTRILGNIPGLVSKTSADAKSIFYSASNQGGTFSSFVYTINPSLSLISPVQTMADKCVWAIKEPTVIYCGAPTLVPRGNYPDDWYKGTVSFSDTFWKIDTSSLEETLLFNPEREVAVPIDTETLTLSKDEKTLYVINKKDLSLWAISLP